MCPIEGEAANAREDFLRDPYAGELREIFNVTAALFRQATLAFDAGAYPLRSISRSHALYLLARRPLTSEG